MKLKSSEGYAFWGAVAVLAIWIAHSFSFIWGFTDEIFYQFFLGILGTAALECGHAWGLMKTKTYWKDKSHIEFAETVKRVNLFKSIFEKEIVYDEKIKFKLKKRTKYLILYLICAGFTVFAAVSFAGKLIDRLSDKSAITISKISLLQQKIDLNTQLISTYSNQQKRYEMSFNVISSNTNQINKSALRGISNAIVQQQDLIKTNDIYQTEIVNLKLSNQEAMKAKSNDSFEFYSTTFNIPKKIVMLLLLLLFYGGLEYFFCLTMPEEELKRTETFIFMHKELLLSYVDNLVEKDEYGTRCRTDKDISASTKIPLHLCNKFRRMLSGKDDEKENNILYKGLPMINGKKTCSTFGAQSRGDVKKIILSKIALQ